MKKSRFFKKFDELDKQLDRLLQLMEKQPVERLLKSPSPGAWSPIQVLQHLILSEAGSLKYLRKKISSGLQDIPHATWITEARIAVLRFYMLLPLKVKAPRIIGEENFAEVTSFGEVAEEYKKTRQELRAFLENLPEEAFSLEIFRHPIAGKLSLGGLATFFILHFKRHEQQIRRQGVV